MPVEHVKLAEVREAAAGGYVAIIVPHDIGVVEVHCIVLENRIVPVSLALRLELPYASIEERPDRRLSNLFASLRERTEMIHKVVPETQ